MPTSFLNALLRGYFDGDGYISNPESQDPKITLTAKRKDMNILVRSALQRVGFAAMNPISANIEITGLQNMRRFAAQVGARQSCRRARMDAWLEKDIRLQEKDR